MNWLRTAFTICSPDSGAYYTVLDPIEFYEWRFTNKAPKGHIFTRELPPSDIFTGGQIIASAIVPESNMKHTKAGYGLVADGPVDIQLKVGYMPSPQELMEKYENLIHIQNKGVGAFKEDLLIRLYVNSSTDNPHLFRMSHYTDEEVTMHNFGSVEELTKQFALVRSAILDEAMDKTGRSYEMEEFRRYENVMVFTNNSHLHVDASKLDRLIESSGVKALQTKTLPWLECYLDVSPGARQISDRIQHFEDQKWVQAVIARNT